MKNLFCNICITENKTGWTSATRGLGNGDNNPNNDSVIYDKDRLTGIYLGGTIYATYGWKEIITIP